VDGGAYGPVDSTIDALSQPRLDLGREYEQHPPVLVVSGEYIGNGASL
jgi:hypothetical protein